GAGRRHRYPDAGWPRENQSAAGDAIGAALPPARQRHTQRARRRGGRSLLPRRDRDAGEAYRAAEGIAARIRVHQRDALLRAESTRQVVDGQSARFLRVSCDRPPARAEFAVGTSVLSAVAPRIIGSSSYGIAPLP